MSPSFDHIFKLEHYFCYSSFLLYIQCKFIKIFVMKKIFIILVSVGLWGCAGHYDMPTNFEYKPITTHKHKIATWKKITNNSQPIHIYVEGDGHAFYNNGTPTKNPTPYDSFVRDLATHDLHANVVYIARPCQFIMDNNCDFHDWTDARFSQSNVDAMADAIRNIANGRQIILIGYSGGAMVSGLVIKQNPDIKIKKWITIAGVLNHHDWTNYFGDAPLTQSIDLDSLPNIPQIHYVGNQDSVVPLELSKKWIKPQDMRVIDGATHNNFPNLILDFD